MVIALNYIRKGTGEPLVLLHGIGHRWQAFEPIINRLAEKYDVIAVDQLGFGDSPGLPGNEKYTVERLTEVVIENFELWGIEKPHVVGNSLGGTVAIALGQTGHAASVTALSPGGYYGPLGAAVASIPLTFLKLGAYAPTALLRALTRTAPGRFLIGMALYAHPSRYDADRCYGDSIAMRRAAGFWDIFLGLLPAAFNRPAVLTGEAAVPTTIGWGTRDVLLLPSQAEVATRELRGSIHVPIADSGHVPMGDNPDAVIAAIDATIASAASH